MDDISTLLGVEPTPACFDLRLLWSRTVIHHLYALRPPSDYTHAAISTFTSLASLQTIQGGSQKHVEVNNRQ